MSLHALRATLSGAGYTRDALRAATAAAGGGRRPEARDLALSLALGDDELGRLFALFALGEPVDEQALPALDAGALAARGVLRRDGGRLVPLVRIDELAGAYVCSDRALDAPDAVAPVSQSTRLTAAFTPRAEVERALDVGTGSGAQALLAARHARRVVATDVVPRALELTRLNAELNDVAHIETRAGSFFEPVSGERYGLVVANLPYVVSPDHDFVYRDAGLPGDELSRTLLAELPGLLVQGGYGCLQGNWIHGRDEPWHRPLATALRVAECDALMVRYDTWEPLAYAASWCAPHAHDAGALRATLTRWTDSFAAAGIERISGAVVVLRRRDGARHFRRALSLAGIPAGYGEPVARVFAVHDRLAADPDDLGGLVAAAGLEVERHERPGEPPRAVLTAPGALMTRRPVPPELADYVLRLDGPPPAHLRGRVADLLKLGLLEFAP